MLINVIFSWNNHTLSFLAKIDSLLSHLIRSISTAFTRSNNIDISHFNLFNRTLHDFSTMYPDIRFWSVHMSVSAVCFFSLKCLNFVISLSLIANYNVIILLQGISCLMTYHCLHQLHLNYVGVWFFIPLLFTIISLKVTEVSSWRRVMMYTLYKQPR